MFHQATRDKPAQDVEDPSCDLNALLLGDTWLIDFAVMVLYFIYVR